MQGEARNRGLRMTRFTPTMGRVSRTAAVIAFALAACCLGALFVMVARGGGHSGIAAAKLVALECAAIVLALAFEFRPHPDDLARKETQA